jgi:nucleoside-diphosphate-sugar epimerase
MKILVTGSNGFLGSAIVERLIAHGETDIRCLVRPGSNRSRLEAIQREHPTVGLEIFCGSLATKADAAAAIRNSDVIYHAAAGMRGAAADLFLNSVVSSQHLLEALASEGVCKVILISSFGVYGVGDLPRGHTITETTPMEPHPERRDLYSYSKWRQETLFWEYQRRLGFPLVVMRPGVIYGLGGSAISSRVGLPLFGVFLLLGGRNKLPLSYVQNCAEAIVIAGRSDQAIGQVYNVHDDDLPTCKAFLRLYRQEVRKLRVVHVPYPLLQALSRLVARYHVRSRGQLPAIFTPYKTACSWKGNRFDNTKIKALGWRQIVPTQAGLQQTFRALKAAEQDGGG